MRAPSERGVVLALGVSLLAIAGPGLAIAWGVLPAALVLAAGAALAAWRGRTLARAGGWDRVLAGLPRGPRTITAAMLLLPIVIAVAVAVRGIAGLCVAAPAAAVGIAVLVVLAPGVARVRGRGAPVAGIAAAGLAVLATVLAARFEAAAPGARGFAHSGPILGIHPFQSTAILIDGYGPFDLPINDYVEPDGSRGYGPPELAEALQRDLRAIAEVHYADGPRRAREAFAGAVVEAVTLPALLERRDRPVAAGATEPRLVVWSGTTGRRSRVEFVCPGTTVDPRPRGPDTVMERMCPDKYASEASAGLGLTGRWTGYTEGRGQGRVSLAPLVEELPAPGNWEERLWAWLVLACLIPGLRWRGWSAGLLRASGGVVGAGLAGLLVMVFGTWSMMQVGWLEGGPGWASPWGVGPWVAALPVMLVVALAGRAGLGLAGGTLALMVWSAGSLAAAALLRPGLAGGSLEAWTAGIAERLTRVDLATAEAIAALGLGAALLLGLAALLGPAVRTVATAAGWRRPGSIGLVIVVAAGLVVLSRKTSGGAVLWPTAVALALAATSGLAAAIGGRGRGLRVADHLAAIGLVGVAALEAVAGRSNGFVLAGSMAAMVAAAASLVLLRVRGVDLPAGDRGPAG